MNAVTKFFTTLVLVVPFSFCAEEQKPASDSSISTGRPNFTLDTGVYTAFVNFTGHTVSPHAMEVETLGFKLPDIRAGELKLFDVSGSILKMTNIDTNFSYGKAGNDETDLSVAIQRDFGPVKAELREIYFGITPERQLDNDFHAESLRMEFKAPFVTPYFKVWRISEIGDNSPHGGWAGWIGITRNNELPGVKLAGKNIAVMTDIYISAMKESSKYNRPTGMDNFQACLSAPLPIKKLGGSKSFELVPAVRFVVPFRTDCGDFYTLRNKQVWMLSARFKF